MKRSSFKLVTIVAFIPAVVTSLVAKAVFVHPLIILISAIFAYFFGILSHIFFVRIIATNLEIGAVDRNVEVLFNVFTLLVYMSSAFFCFRFILNIIFQGVTSIDLIIAVFGIGFIRREMNTHANH